MKKIILIEIALGIILLCIAGGTLKLNNISLFSVKEQNKYAEKIKVRDNHVHGLISNAEQLEEEKVFAVFLSEEHKRNVNTPDLIFMNKCSVRQDKALTIEQMFDRIYLSGCPTAFRGMVSYEEMKA